MQISLTDLRRTPAAALDHVRNGEEVIVTEDGIPFMRMVPTGQPTRFEALVAAGVVKPPRDRHDLAEIRKLAVEGWKGTPE